MKKENANSAINFIEESLYRMIVVARIKVEEQHFTEEEIKHIIADKGNEIFNKIFNMDYIDFGLLVLKETLRLSLNDNEHGSE